MAYLFSAITIPTTTLKPYSRGYRDVHPPKRDSFRLNGRAIPHNDHPPPEHEKEEGVYSSVNGVYPTVMNLMEYQEFRGALSLSVHGLR